MRFDLTKQQRNYSVWKRKIMKKTTLAAALATTLIASAAMADPLPAGYNPGFSAAKLSTHSIGVNKDVTLTITGMGVCKKFKVNWGDTSESVDEFDFGYGASLKPLVKAHKYTKGGKYFPSVAEVFGDSLAERCGSRTDVPDSSLTVTEPGKVTGMTVTPPKTQVGQTVEVSVEGSGQCEQPRRIVTEYREVENVPNSAVSTVKTFATSEQWPRKGSFVAAKEGFYLVYWLGTDSISSPTGDCVFYSFPIKVEVKKVGPALPIVATPIRMPVPMRPAASQLNTKPVK